MSGTTGPSVIGTLHRALSGRGAVRMETLVAADAADLWSALTEPARLARWVAEVSGDLRVGGRVETRFTSSWAGPGEIEVCDAPTRLVVRMDPGSEDETVIEATLVPEGARTRLVIEERGIPLDELPAHGAGWQAHVEDLGAHLAGTDPEAWESRWHELAPEYRDRAILGS